MRDREAIRTVAASTLQPQFQLWDVALHILLDVMRSTTIRMPILMGIQLAQRLAKVSARPGLH